jgi:hypothetical protein
MIKKVTTDSRSLRAQIPKVAELDGEEGGKLIAPFQEARMLAPGLPV